MVFYLVGGVIVRTMDISHCSKLGHLNKKRYHYYFYHGAKVKGEEDPTGKQMTPRIKEDDGIS